MDERNVITQSNLDKKSTYIDGAPSNLFFIEGSFYLVRKEIINKDFKTIIEAQEVIKIAYTDASVIREDTRSLYLEFYNFKGKRKNTTIYIDGGYYSFGAFVKTHFIPIDKMYKEWCS